MSDPRARTLLDFLAAAAASRPAHIAVEAPPAASITYAALDALSDRVRDRLRQMGVTKGDRVGVCVRKSIDAYASILGAMKAGAAYVPVDPAAPAWRSAFITHDCALTALVIEQGMVANWQVEAERLGPLPELLAIGPQGLTAALDSAELQSPAPSAPTAVVAADDPAYILYTSGSTGTPKGVVLTQACATSHVDWFTSTFAPTDDDRFSSHAPFHFDLSITDLYVPLKMAATVVLIPTDLGKDPLGLAALIADRRLTVWYSTPTTLMMLAEFGRLGQHDYSALRYVNFAGEVFPVKHLRAVKALLPRAQFFNLYGPTETNVCTWHPIPNEVEPDRTDPYPIGKACSHFQSRVLDERGEVVPIGTEGELLVHRTGTMAGYFNDVRRTASAFLVDDLGRRWYRTGDVVVEDAGGVLTFIGRRDRMVKRRGYRIELGEIEAGLYRHESVKEAAVTAVTDDEGILRIKAFLTVEPGQRVSAIAIRAFCAKVLPAYMIPDAFAFMDGLPKTSTDKVDYQSLAQA